MKVLRGHHPLGPAASGNSRSRSRIAHLEVGSGRHAEQAARIKSGQNNNGIGAMVLLLIYIIFAVAFFGGLLVDYNVIPPAATLISESSVYLLFCVSIFLKRKDSSFRHHLGYIYVSFIIVAIASAFLNGYLNVSVIIGIRPVLRFYILYLALINLDLSERQYKNINNLLFVLFILQLPGSAIRYFFQGVQEDTIGTYAGHGGGLTPIIPIVALGYLAGFYTAVRPRLIYLLLGLGFILYGIAGAKRAIFFMYPIAFLGIYYLAFFMAKKTSIFKHLALLMLLCIGIIGVQVLAIKVMPSLNPEHKIGGSVDYEHIFKFTEKYESQTGRHGSGASRFSTTILTLKTVMDAGIGEIFFGFGPGSLTTSELDTTFSGRKRVDRRLIPLEHSYGHTGMTYIFAEYGLCGLVALISVFLIFMHRSLRWFRLEVEPYWKALSIGTVVFAFLQTFIFFAYNQTPVTSRTIVPVYFYAMSLIFYRLNRR